MSRTINAKVFLMLMAAAMLVSVGILPTFLWQFAAIANVFG